MKLKAKARLVLLNLLPAESNFSTWKTINKLKEDLYFSEDETKLLKFTNENSPDGDWKAYIQYLENRIQTDQPNDTRTELQNCLNEFNRRFTVGQTTWNEKADKEVEVKIGELATQVISARLDSISGADWSPDIWWLAVVLADGGLEVEPSIVKALNTLDKESKLRPEHIPLYERFVEGKKEA